ncbi:hypothetical protein MINTM020_39800 [Mycobacterium paraintracellulare]|uniref:hypothetical protein n=1 Tax=Mycobacterium paraintracellulare TaxID=1138383 RepID=UPI001929082D|nr:hypothetical protein [Mycobacterium paraintracellulare]BCP11882.1 hypothetical protein MINTM020_39800 [Mycobacterium paraintracellulare]
MVTATVYRAAARNEHGDPIDQDGNVVRDDETAIGTIGVIIGGDSGSTRSVSQDSGLLGDVVRTAGMVGYPIAAGITLQPNDILRIGGQRLKVIGPSLWPDIHSLSGRPLRYRWVSYVAN